MFISHSNPIPVLFEHTERIGRPKRNVGKIRYYQVIRLRAITQQIMCRLIKKKVEVRSNDNSLYRIVWLPRTTRLRTIGHFY